MMWPLHVVWSTSRQPASEHAEAWMPGHPRNGSTLAERPAMQGSSGAGPARVGGWARPGCGGRRPERASGVALRVHPFEGHRLRQHPVPQIEPEAWHPQIDDEPWESQIERASVPAVSARPPAAFADRAAGTVFGRGIQRVVELSPGGSRGLKVGLGNCRFKRMNFEGLDFVVSEARLCRFLEKTKHSPRFRRSAFSHFERTEDMSTKSSLYKLRRNKRTWVL